MTFYEFVKVESLKSNTRNSQPATRNPQLATHNVFFHSMFNVGVFAYLDVRRSSFSTIPYTLLPTPYSLLSLPHVPAHTSHRDRP